MKVAAIHVESYDQKAVASGLQEALDLIGGLSSMIRPNEKILIKPNMLEALSPDKAVTTHPEVVRAVIRAVRAAGGLPFVGDSPALGNTLKTAQKTGIMDICNAEGVEVLPFHQSVDIALPHGTTMKKFQLAKELTEMDKVISVAKMKTHSLTGITGSIKNLFGFVVGTGKAQFHLRMNQRRDFAAMLVDLSLAIKPCLFVIDGIIGMEGRGPRNGDPIHLGALLAGTNGFAVDMVMSRLMGFPVNKLPVTARAMELGLVSALTEIEIVGSAKDRIVPCKAPRNIESLDERVPAWMANFGRAQLTAKPVIDKNCVGCGRCEAHCPPKSITIRNNKAAINDSTCIRCYCCQELCPHDAVLLEEGMLLRLIKKIK